MAESLVIIGSGHGGVEMAAALRRQGYEGSVTLLSDESCLPYHKPPLSKAFLKDAAAQPQALRPEAFYQQNRIEWRPDTRAIEIDTSGCRLLLQDGRFLAFSHLVLATGARARRLPIAGHELGNVLYLRHLQEARTLREAAAGSEQIVVIGGGFIGLEVAATLAGQGKSVRVLEVAPRILGRAVAPAVSEHMAGWHRNSGIDIRTDIKIERFEADGKKVSAVRLCDGEALAADLVIIGAGAVPNTEMAEQAGLTCENGICADAFLHTSVANIRAIGDCVSYPHWQAGRSVRLESVQNATDQARHIAGSMVGKSAPYHEVPWFWSDQGDARLQMAGLSFDPDRYEISGSLEDNSFSVWHFRAGTLLSVDSVNHPVEHMIARKLLAAGINPTPEQILQGSERLKALVMEKPAKSL